MTRWFSDYRLSRGRPVGVGQFDRPPVDTEHYALHETTTGVRIEQYDAAGCFVRLCIAPEDAFDRNWDRVERNGGRARIFRDSQGIAKRYETYEPTGEHCGEVELLRGRMYNADGRLVMQHDPRKVSETEYEIAVRDGTGRHMCLLHHADVDGPEPFSITEDWPD